MIQRLAAAVTTTVSPFGRPIHQATWADGPAMAKRRSSAMDRPGCAACRKAAVTDDMRGNLAGPQQGADREAGMPR
jgi:hypothetical protein